MSAALAATPAFTEPDVLTRLERMYGRRCSAGLTSPSTAARALMAVEWRQAERAGLVTLNPVHRTYSVPDGAVHDIDWWMDRVVASIERFETHGSAALWPERYPEPLRPFHPLPTATADEARVQVRHHVRGFLDRVLAWHAVVEEEREAAKVSALAVEVGAGKTSITATELPGFIARAKAAGLPHRVLFAVPTHKLGSDIVARLEGLGLHVAAYRGRKALVDPHGPKGGPAMCDNLAAVEDAEAALLDAETVVCGKDGGVRCPFAGRCAYQLQKPAAAEADIVVLAHEGLLGHLPAAIGTGFALVIGDESWTFDGVETRTLTLDTLLAGPTEQPIMIGGDPPRRAEEATANLHHLRLRLAKALEAIEGAPGYLTRDALVAAELSAEDCIRAGGLEWRRKVDGAMHPGMTAAQRKEARERCAGNAAIPKLAALWKAAAELLESGAAATGRVELGHRNGAEGSQRIILLHTSRPVAKRVQGLPFLPLDASLAVELLRHRLPTLEVLAEARATAPHMRVHQILGGFGKTSIVPDPDPQKRGNPGKRDRENQRRLNLLAKLRDFILLTTAGARSLIVTYKELEPHFQGLPGVETAHFGDIEGRDGWGPQPSSPGIRFLFQIGRPLPSPEATRQLGAGITGKPLPAEIPGLVTRGATMRDGTARPIGARAYADPDLEAVRAAITDAATVQVVGRGRGINRTAANPLDAFVFAGDIIVPLPLDSLTDWQDVAPGPSARMAAQGVVLESARDAAAAYGGDLLPEDEDAVRQALSRERRQGEHRDIPLWMTPIGECHDDPGWVRVEYRPNLPKAKTRIAWARPDRLPTLRAWLETVTRAELVHYAPPATAPAPAPIPTPATPPELPQEATVPPPAPAPIHSPAFRLASLAMRLEAVRPTLDKPASTLTPPRHDWWRDRAMLSVDQAFAAWRQLEEERGPTPRPPPWMLPHLATLGLGRHSPEETRP